MTDPFDTFLETNHIDPIILKYTQKVTRPETMKREYKCGGCRNLFFYDDLHPWKYAEGSQILLCVPCFQKRKRR